MPDSDCSRRLRGLHSAAHFKSLQPSCWSWQFAYCVTHSHSAPVALWLVPTSESVVDSSTAVSGFASDRSTTHVEDVGVYLICFATVPVLVLVSVLLITHVYAAACHCIKALRMTAVARQGLSYCHNALQCMSRSKQRTSIQATSSPECLLFVVLCEIFVSDSVNAWGFHKPQSGL
jgi:hypothetical protein